MKKALLAAALCAAAFPALTNAQSRERHLADFAWDGARVSLTATPAALEITAAERADFVLLYLNPAEVDSLADSLQALVTTTYPAPPKGEVVKYEASSSLSGPVVKFERAVTRAGSRFTFFMTDEYVVNSVLADITSSQARSFLAALRKGAATSRQMAATEHPPEELR